MLVEWVRACNGCLTVSSSRAGQRYCEQVEERFLPQPPITTIPPLVGIRETVIERLHQLLGRLPDWISRREVWRRQRR